MGGCWYEGNVLAEVLVLIEESGVEALLGKCNDCLFETVPEFCLNRFLLAKERVFEAVVGDGFPVVETIDLAVLVRSTWWSI